PTTAGDSAGAIDGARRGGRRRRKPDFPAAGADLVRDSLSIAADLPADVYYRYH
ncbi:diguanylate cyclase, partial [Klebsiella aerogenes]